MWSDPLRSEESVNMDELTRNNGFVHNVRRGTAYMFSNEALNQFLKNIIC